MSRLANVKNTFPDVFDTALQISKPEHKNKYLMWIAEQLNHQHKPEDISATIDAFHTEQKTKKRLKYNDIYNYDDLKVLENEIKDLQTSNRQLHILYKDKGSVKIYDKDNIIVVRINSKNAILYYGKGTRWCIAMEHEYYFENYSASGNVFYVLIDKNKNIKLAIQKRGVASFSLWSENDQRIYIKEDDDKAYGDELDKIYEEALIACLNDRETSMMYKISKTMASAQEVSEWLKDQHPVTIKYLRQKKVFAFYSLDVSQPLTKIITQVSKLKSDDLQKVLQQNPELINNICEYLKNNNKNKYKNLRKHLCSIVENPEGLLNQEDIDLIRFSKDKSIGIDLIHSENVNVWKKVLSSISPNILLKIATDKSNKWSKDKVSYCVQYVCSKTSKEKLIKWIVSNVDLNTLPKNIWDSHA